MQITALSREPGQPAGSSSASALALLTCPKYLNPRAPLAWGGTRLGHPPAGVAPGLPGQGEVGRDVGQAVPPGPAAVPVWWVPPSIPHKVWGSLSPGQGDTRTGGFGSNKARPWLHPPWGEEQLCPPSSRAGSPGGAGLCPPHTGGAAGAARAVPGHSLTCPRAGEHHLQPDLSHACRARTPQTEAFPGYSCFCLKG